MFRKHLKCNPKSSAPCFTSNEILLQCHCPLRVELYLFHRCSGIGAIWANWDMNTPNLVPGHLKSNPKSAAPYFTSNEILLQCHCPLRVELYLFHRCSGIGAIWGNWTRINNTDKSCKGKLNINRLKIYEVIDKN